MTTAEITKKIIADTNYPEKVAKGIAQRLLCADNRLAPVIDSWLKGNECSFSYGGITISEIRDKTKASLPEAVLLMNRMLKDSEYLDRFKKARFIKR